MSSRRAATSISAISISRRRRATAGSARSSCAGWASGPQRKEKNFTLEVLKNNRARGLYERLGFRVIETSPLKFTMQFNGT